MRLVTRILKQSFVLFLVLHFNAISQSRIHQFSATQYKKTIYINFIVTPGSTCSGYQIQHSIDSTNFNAIYDYFGVCGEQSKAQSFSYTDENPIKNNVNYYRVFIPPNDYSEINRVNYYDLSEKGYLIFNNPMNQYLNILTTNYNGIMKIYNQTGGLMKSISANENGLYYEDITSLDSGLYLFLIESNQGKNITGKFLKN